MLKKALMATIIFSMPLFAMHRGTMNISDLDLEVSIDLDAGQFIESYAVDNYFFGGGFLSTQDGKGGSLYNLHGFVMNDLPNVEGARFGAGMKLVSTSRNGENFLAIPVGAIVEYHIPNKNELPITIIGSIFYAPGSLSFADSRTYYEGRIGMAYDMLENMRAFFEYRTVHTNYNGAGDTLFNETLSGGMRIGF